MKPSLFIFALAFSLVTCFSTQAPAETGSAPDVEENPATAKTGKSLTELNKKLVNPVSTIWSLTFENNNYWLNMPSDHADRVQSNLLFQPVLPVGLTSNWNLITRPVIPLAVSTPYVNSQGDLDRTTGFGDVTLIELVSPGPKLAGNWILGLGPTFIFPTASTPDLGQEKWQAGPAAVVGYLGEKFAGAVFPQQWWSMGGSGEKSTSQLNLQYFFMWFPGDGWNVGMSPNILVDWKAAGGEQVTLPIGLGIGKVFKFGPLPVKINVEAQYMLVRPDTFGQEWNVQLKITPVIPKLIKGYLFGDG